MRCFEIPDSPYKERRHPRAHSRTEEHDLSRPPDRRMSGTRRVRRRHGRRPARAQCSEPGEPVRRLPRERGEGVRPQSPQHPRRRRLRFLPRRRGQAHRRRRRGDDFAFKATDTPQAKTKACLTCHASTQGHYMSGPHGQASLDCATCHSVHGSAGKTAASEGPRGPDLRSLPRRNDGQVRPERAPQAS